MSGFAAHLSLLGKRGALLVEGSVPSNVSPFQLSHGMAYKL